ncbi:hypothetical protein HYQ45_003163 [Verticillium longisporum]|uniref:Uncharacterized protein n=1 Tax=Verticillium longisporum TaxID=100787 RepID=A0A8I2ZW30_VERLO|nr:hypothetical protein HYQ45_003163 [Verticillium longisporum]
MGDATIEGSKWRLVEVGRVVLIEGNHPAFWSTDRPQTPSSLFPAKRFLSPPPFSLPWLSPSSPAAPATAP